MASFLAGPAAQLLGAGLQAVGVGIPVSGGCNKLLEGLRDVGLPVPPKNWFKHNGGGSCQGGSCEARSEPKQNLYDKLESHVQGVMQVVKPVMELKSVIASGCKSADRGQRVGIPSSCGRAMRCARQRSYSTDECCRPDGACRSNPPPQQRVLQKKRSVDKECRLGKRGCPSVSSEEEDDEGCMYCSQAKCSMLKLPCGRTICAKCYKSESHELQSKMPRPLKRKKLPDPVDIIDLTQEPPSNTTLRLSRSRSHSANWEIIPLSCENDVENVHNQRECTRRRVNNQPATVINLDETINLDDSPSKPTKSQNPVLTESPKAKTLSCPICMENLAGDKIKAMTTPCGHVFCYDCLKIITESKKKCSLCQRAITFSKCIRLHI